MSCKKGMAKGGAVVEATIVFKKGSAKPWKIMAGSKELGSAMTRKEAENKSTKMQSYQKSGKTGGIDEMLDETIEKSPAPIKGALAKTAGKKLYTPARGQMEGEQAQVEIDEE